MEPRPSLRLTLLGVGAMRSPRYLPAGLLVEYRGRRIAIDGGPEARIGGRLDAWLVTDERSELRSELRDAARRRGLAFGVSAFTAGRLRLEPRPVVHTSHPAFGYAIEAAGRRAVWAPEFWTFPGWAADADLMFAEAAGWNRPIRFAGGVGGHMAALEVAREARARGVKRLVFAHIGRPSIRARDAGESPAFGEWGDDGRSYRLRVRAR
jgi:hypothetical protein